MKKLQLAHTDAALSQVKVPDINVTDLSSPMKNHKHLDVDKPEQKAAEVNGNINGTQHIPLPLSHVDLKNHFHPLKASQSESGVHHTHYIADQGKHVYHSEPANLNGFVSASPLLSIQLFCYYGVDA